MNMKVFQEWKKVCRKTSSGRISNFEKYPIQMTITTKDDEKLVLEKVI